MKKTALVGAFALVAAACAPSIPKATTPDHTYIEFDPAASPAVVPTPTSLAQNPTTGQVQIPVDPSSSQANQDFLNNYLNTLDGYPGDSAASASVHGDLDPASVNASTVMVVDLATQAPVSGATIQYDPQGHTISVIPPGGTWSLGHTYEVVILGGPSGVKAKDGSQVYGSAAWALARSAQSLVACDGAGACHSTSGLLSDAQATALEQVRKGYAPLFDALEAQGVPRADVAVLWTFGITTHPELRFDPAHSVIPFPSDLVRTGPGGTINLPAPAGSTLPDGGMTLEGQLYAGLNTLDGFSTTAPIVSENSDTQPVLEEGLQLDPASITAATLGLFPLGSVATPPNVKVCLLPDMPGCASTTEVLADGGYALPDGGAVPQQLQIIPVNPLEGGTEYGYFFTTGLTAKNGKSVIPTPAFVLMRLKDSLLDSNDHSTVTGVTDAEAQQLEPARAGMAQFFDALQASSIPRQNIALATPFKTQSEQSVLNQLAQIPSQAGASLPADPITLTENTALCGGNCAAIGIGHAFTGTLLDPLLLTGTGGTLNPSAPTVRPIPFILTLPPGTTPTNGWPVVIFGHGFQGNRTQAMAIASSLAQAGFAMVAIDEVWHGERVSCTGLGSFADSLVGAAPGTFSDGVACNVIADPNAVCDEQLPIGHCVAGPTASDLGEVCTYLSPTDGDSKCQVDGQGACRPTADGLPGASQCDGADWTRDGSGQPAIQLAPGAYKEISGWNLFNLNNLFATRDNLRQQVVDDAQVVRMLQSTTTTNLNVQLDADLSTLSPLIDSTQIQYVGQSLGGILGTLFASAAPNVHKTVLNVPAGDLLQIFLTTPNTSFGALRTGFFNTLAANGIVPGTPSFDTFVGIAKWIMDPADPVNAGYGLTHGVVPNDRQAFIQYIEGDHFLPNPTTQELIGAAAAAPPSTLNLQQGSAGTLDWFEFTQADPQFNGIWPTDPDDLHGFLLNGTPSSSSPGTLSGFAQSQVVQFLDAGTVKTTFP